jgi:hypothetical protein
MRSSTGYRMRWLWWLESRARLRSVVFSVAFHIPQRSSGNSGGNRVVHDAFVGVGRRPCDLHTLHVSQTGCEALGHSIDGVGLRFVVRSA